jgi:alpha-D-xyloside xylohydrolase
VLGQEAYLAVKSALSLRATLIDYLKAQVALLAKEGTPVMRPLWFDFATDDAAQAVEDQVSQLDNQPEPDSASLIQPV